MHLVLLEVFIVVVATRAVLSLLGMATPAWPNPLWVMFALVGIAASTALIVTELRKRFAHRRAEPAMVAPPHIPLDRIAPFTEEALVVRYGASGRANIHLN
jgi:hypothetical protein